jgi:hypothetical protein
MSSASQPENNGLSRQHPFAAQVRHPVGGASLWQLLRAARGDRHGLSSSQRDVLAAIRDELQADAELATSFSAFTGVTIGAAMPKTEQLPASGTLARWRRRGRALLNWRIMIVVAAMVTFVALLVLALTASSPGRQQNPCALTCPATSGAPAGVNGQSAGSTLPPAYSFGQPW